jgi:hypothetical protein
MFCPDCYNKGKRNKHGEYPTMVSIDGEHSKCPLCGIILNHKTGNYSR